MATRRKYTEDVLRDAVDHSTSIAGVLRHLGLKPTGGAHAHISRTIKAFGIDTSHFRRYSPLAHATTRLKPSQILVRLAHDARRAKPPMLTRALVESDVPYACAICGCDGTWQGTAADAGG